MVKQGELGFPVSQLLRVILRIHLWRMSHSIFPRRRIHFVSSQSCTIDALSFNLKQASGFLAVS